MSLRDTWNNWLLKQNWLDSPVVNNVVKPFEAGSRFGIGGGVDWSNPATWAGAAAGAISLVPGSVIKGIQAARVAGNLSRAAELGDLARGIATATDTAEAGRLAKAADRIASTTLKVVKAAPKVIANPLVRGGIMLASSDYQNSINPNAAATPGALDGGGAGDLSGLGADGLGLGGSGTGTEAWQPRYWEGQLYHDISSYTAAVNSTILRNYNDQVAGIDSMYKAGLINLDEREKQIRDTRTKLGAARDDALASQKGYFNQISPNASQSQEQTYANKAQAEYQAGADQLGADYGSGNGSFRDLTPEQLSQMGGGLNETGRLIRDYLNLKSSRDQNVQQAGQARVAATDTNLNDYVATTGNVPTGSIADYGPSLKSIYGTFLGGNPNAAPQPASAFAVTTPNSKLKNPLDPYSSFGG
jgi:hypothetical protein